MVAREALAPYDQVIVLSGDAPLITADTIQKLSAFHNAQKAAMTLLSADLANPIGYGRVLRKTRAKSAEVRAIVEEKAANAAQKKIREINSGFYAFSVPALYQHIDELSTNNAHGEYYLTDMAASFSIARARKWSRSRPPMRPRFSAATRAPRLSISTRACAWRNAGS